MESGLPRWIGLGIPAAVFLLFFWLESLRPLRRRRESRLRRTLRNLATAGIGLATIELLQIPILVPVSRWVTANGVGLLNLLSLRGWVRTAAAVP